MSNYTNENRVGDCIEEIFDIPSRFEGSDKLFFDIELDTLNKYDLAK